MIDQNAKNAVVHVVTSLGTSIFNGLDETMQRKVLDRLQSTIPGMTAQPNEGLPQVWKRAAPRIADYFLEGFDEAKYRATA